MKIRRILVPTDFSASAEHALTKAVDLAKRLNATLHILHVVDELDPDFYGLDEAQDRAVKVRERIRQEAASRLEALAPTEEAVNFKTRVSVQLSFDVAATINEYIDEQEIDLVVMGTRGRRGIERLMLGNVADKLVRHADTPIITVGEQVPWETREADQLIQDILAPVDFSDHSKQAVHLAKVIAGVYDARLHLLFVAEKRVIPTFSDTGIPGVGVVEMDEEIVANADQALRQLADEIGGPDVQVKTTVVHGRVAKEVIDYAEERGVDMIVMATRGLSGVQRYLLGSNTERIVRVAPCPVLTMATEKREPAEAEAAE